MNGMAWLLVLSCLVLVGAPAWAGPDGHDSHRAGHAPHAGEPAAPAGRGLGLAELTALALAKNPALESGKGEEDAAQGRALQAGLYPNPHLGYKLEELGTRGPGSSGAHYLFMEQRLVLGGKLDLAKEAADREVASLKGQGRAARAAVLAALAVSFHQALAAQQVLDLRRALTELAREGEEVTRQYRNVGQADLPDLLAAEVEVAKAEVEQGQAQRDLDLAWSRLKAVVGDAALEARPLNGDPDQMPPSPGAAAELTPRLASHPALAAAQARIGKNEALLRLEQARTIPDVTFKVGAGYDLAPRDDNRDEGWKGFFEASLPVPWFDDNRGSQAAALAEKRRAHALRRQVEQDLLTGLEQALAREKALRHKVERYALEILPKARQSQAMYLRSHMGMTAAYSQALVARRNWLMLKVEHAADLGELWGQVAHIQSLQGEAGPTTGPHTGEASHGH